MARLAHSSMNQATFLFYLVVQNAALRESRKQEKQVRATFVHNQRVHGSLLSRYCMYVYAICTYVQYLYMYVHM